MLANGWAIALFGGATAVECCTNAYVNLDTRAQISNSKYRTERPAESGNAWLFQESDEGLRISLRGVIF